MHYHFINDDRGELLDIMPFCCDSCHQQWCKENGAEYGGWNGAHESGDYGDYLEFCAQCGTVAGGPYECDCQRDNVVVNRFPSDDGEQCEQHGNWLQVPLNFIKIPL